MKKSQQVEKKRLFWDGQEIAGLIIFPELKLEDGIVIVPGYDYEVPVANSIIKIPTLELKYKVEFGTNTMKFWRDFRFGREIHEGLMQRTNGVGDIIERWLLQQCECASISIPQYDAENIVYSSVTVLIAPGKIIPL